MLLFVFNGMTKSPSIVSETLLQEEFQPQQHDALMEFWDAAKLQSLRDFLTFSEHTSVHLDARDVQVMANAVTNESWWNARTKDEQRWWNATSKKILVIAARDANATAHETKSLWNSTVQQVEKDESATAIALKKDEKNLAKNWNHIWNATVHQLAQDETAVANWYSATERVVEDSTAKDAQAVERAMEAAWRATEVTAEKEVVSAETTEHTLWNATNAWLASHMVQSDSTPAKVTYLNTSFAYSLLSDRSGYFDFSNDFFSVRPEAQINQAYCGIASAAAVLNSFHIGSDPTYQPYAYTTQKDLLAHCSKQLDIVVNGTYNGIFHAPGGLTIDAVATLLECHTGVSATVQHVDPTKISLQDMQNDISQALLNPKQRIIVNYHRQAVGQVGGGHFSPLVSRNDNLLLVSDVAKYKYPPAWIEIDSLYDSVSTLDPCASYDHAAAAAISKTPTTKKAFDKALAKLQCQPNYRGYIIVSKD